MDIKKINDTQYEETITPDPIVVVKKLDDLYALRDEFTQRLQDINAKIDAVEGLGVKTEAEVAQAAVAEDLIVNE